MNRPDWIEWALGIADAVATRGDCTRRQVGAVILDRNHWPVAVGYNGSYPGGPSCLKGDCPRGRHYRVDGECDVTDHFYLDNPMAHECPPDACACGGDWPCLRAAAPGSSYDTGPGACISVHAELNARLHVADVSRLEGGTLVVTAEPCDGCLKIYRSTPISKIYWRADDGAIRWNRHPFGRN